MPLILRVSSLLKLFFLISMITFISLIFYNINHYFDAKNITNFISDKVDFKFKPEPDFIYNENAFKEIPAFFDEILSYSSNKNVAEANIQVKKMADVLVVYFDDDDRVPHNPVEMILSSLKVKYLTCFVVENALSSFIRFSRTENHSSVFTILLYKLVIFTSLRAFNLTQQKSSISFFDSYYKNFSAQGKVIVITSTFKDDVNEFLFQGLGIHLRLSRKPPISLSISNDSNIPFITKAIQISSPYFSFTPTFYYFHINSSSLIRPVASFNSKFLSFPLPIVVAYASPDQAQKVLFSLDLNFWPMKFLFVDSLRHLLFTNSGENFFSLNRSFLLDIDDIFVGKHNFKGEDTQALISFQNNFKTFIPSFRFNLGFCGGLFNKSSKGYSLLLNAKNSFWWFPHMFKHRRVIDLNITSIIDSLRKNREFAKQHSIAQNNKYFVSPAHVGTFPTMNELYSALSQVEDTKVTSTMNYPQIRPSYNRHGFMHRGIAVLPRHSLGVYSRHFKYEDFAANQIELLEKSRAGELFDALLLRPINVFMTHAPNYMEDRLALFILNKTFELYFHFTNLKFSYLQPIPLAQKYFDIYSYQRQVIWNNPCFDTKNLEIWHRKFECRRFPSILIVGPQKTGSTALHFFLSLNPLLKTSKTNPTTFEEVQFFTNEHRYNDLGIEWYLDQFQNISNSTANIINYEKSATYFDSTSAMIKIKKLLPHAKIVIILRSPIDRAYSWYQHMLAHKNVHAMNHTFEEVLAGKSGNKNLLDRILRPGLYYKYTTHWLKRFSPAQIEIVDGDAFARDPIPTMQSLQKRILPRNSMINYSHHLKFVPSKKFYCAKSIDGGHKCLGVGKGRPYASMSSQATFWLQKYYSADINKLCLLFQRMGLHRMPWFEDC